MMNPRPQSWLSRHIRTIGTLGFLTIYSVGVTFAAPPATKYQPGETLNPNCAPTATNCSVQILPDQTGNANKLLTTDGNITSWTDELDIIDLDISGDIRFDLGGGGSIVFEDGSVMSSAGAGSAASVSSALDALVTADSDNNGSGDLVFETGNTAQLTIENDGTITVAAFGAGIVHSSAGGLLTSSLIVNGDITDGTIANAKLANSAVTIGSTSISLGGTSTTLAGLTSVASTSFTGALTGNSSTTTALAANGANCTAGSAPLGINASGAVESCFDVWTEAENTSAAYAPLASPTFTGTVTIPTPFTLGATSVTTTGTQLNYLSSASGTTGTTSTNLVFSTSPTLVTPNLGTPSVIVLTNATGTAGSLSIGGNAANATALQTARSINGTSFNGTADITVTAAAGTLTGTTLASNVVTSSLTTVGALDTGSITSGFGAINIGSDALTAGAISGTTGTFSATLADTGGITGLINATNTYTAGAANVHNAVLANAYASGSSFYRAQTVGASASNKYFFVGQTGNGSSINTNNILIATNGDITSTGAITGTAASFTTGAFSGNVGVGSSTNPYGFARNLTVSAGTSGAVDAGLTLQGSRTSDDPFAGIQGYHGSNRVGTIFFNRDGADNSGAISFLTASAGSIAERMRITSAGNVGIGTASPTGGLLQVESGTAARNAIYASNNNATYATLSLNNAATNGYGIYSVADRNYISGNVGIGTASPAGQLALKNQVISANLQTYTATNGVDGQSIFNSYYTVAANGDVGTFPRFLDIASVGAPDGTNGGGVIRFLTNPITNNSPAVERMRIISNGNVGIGTTSPGSKFEVAGSENTFITAVRTSFSGGEVGFGIQSSGGTSSYVYHSVSSNNLRIYSGGDRITINATTGMIQFNSYGAGALSTDSSGNITASSDERLKDKQGDFDLGLDAIRGINPIIYKWNALSGMEMHDTYVGFSAQNVQSVIPQAVDTDPRGYLTLQDRPIMAAAINAIKELDIKVAAIPEFEDQDLYTKIASFLEGIANGVADIARVRTSELCVDDVCVTRDQFMQMVQTSGTAQSSGGGDDSEQEDEGEPQGDQQPEEGEEGTPIEGSDGLNEPPAEEDPEPQPEEPEPEPEPDGEPQGEPSGSEESPAPAPTPSE